MCGGGNDGEDNKCPCHQTAKEKNYGSILMSKHWLCNCKISNKILKIDVIVTFVLWLSLKSRDLEMI